MSKTNTKGKRQSKVNESKHVENIKSELIPISQLVP